MELEQLQQSWNRLSERLEREEAERAEKEPYKIKEEAEKAKKEAAEASKEAAEDDKGENGAEGWWQTDAAHGVYTLHELMNVRNAEAIGEYFLARRIIVELL